MVQEAELFVRGEGGRAGAPTVTRAVLIRSITCEGVGVATTQLEAMPPAGAPIELRFYVAARPVTVPGTIAWRGHVAAAHGAMDAGIRFRFDRADPESARTYADWIVDRISQVVRQEQALGALLVRSAGLPLARLQEAFDEGRRNHRDLADVLLSRAMVTPTQLERALHHRLTPAPLPPAPELLAWRAQIDSSIP